MSDRYVGLVCRLLAIGVVSFQQSGRTPYLRGMEFTKLTLAVALTIGSIQPNYMMEQTITPQTEPAASTAQKQSYVGMWVTKDGYIRHELLPNGRYDEARGKKKSAYQGRYTLTGNHIDYVDDTGFTADGDFRDEALYHGGMVLVKEKC